MTKIYIAKSSVEVTNSIIEKNLNYFSKADYMSQLRQLRSQFSSKSTYWASRCSSIYTNNVAHRPYTVFTVADAEGNDPNLDVKIGSQLCQHIGNQMMFGNGKILKEKVESIIVTDKETTTNTLVTKILNLFEGDSDSLEIIKNAELDSIVTEISQTITPKLAVYNSARFG